MKILFLAPHLSTGGMPAFLLKRIQALQQYTDYQIHVAEWKCYSPTYVVQREQIQSLVGENFISFLGDENSQKGIIDYCYEKQIDIIHIEEIPEGFDSHNPFNLNIQKDLYDSKHPWRIIETPHGMSFNPQISKVYHPDAYACVTPYHADVSYNFDCNNSCLLSFPIDKNIQNNRTKDEILTEKGWRTKGEFHIINVGLWTQGKNQSYALEIAKTLYKKYGFTYIFHFIGNQAPNFQQYWEPLMVDLPPNVIIHGERKDTDQFYKMSDVMLFTSTWECNPLVLKEAISNDLKILSFNLEHYGEEYHPFNNSLTGNINTDCDLLINVVHSPNKYSLNTKIDYVKEFANNHSHLYNFLLNEETKR